MICGLQKMTLLDYPKKVACTVFLGGCNFRCPFCHNSELFMGKPRQLMTDGEFFAFLESRRGLLDGVCVSGGEPTLSPELPRFLDKIKALGFSVKLDTNGSRPQVLRQLLEQGLVDYVAMDVKSSPQGYARTVGLEQVDLPKLEQSLRLLIEGTVEYELRTTLVEPLHRAEDMEQMGIWLASLVPGKKPRELFLQSFVDRDTVLFSGLTAPSEDTVSRYADTLSQYIGKVTIRSK